MLPISLSKGRNGTSKALKRGEFTLLCKPEELSFINRRNDFIPLYFESFSREQLKQRIRSLTNRVTWVFVDTEHTLEVMR